MRQSSYATIVNPSDPPNGGPPPFTQGRLLQQPCQVFPIPLAPLCKGSCQRQLTEGLTQDCCYVPAEGVIPVHTDAATERTCRSNQSLRAAKGSPPPFAQGRLTLIYLNWVKRIYQLRKKERPWPLLFIIKKPAGIDGCQ